MEKLKTLQLFYAGALSDAAYNYGNNGIMEKVTEEKKKLQALAAATQLKQLGINNLEEVYHKFREIFGCAEWDLSRDGDILTAETTGCLLCAVAKKQGSPQPCNAFCINPFSAYAGVFGYDLKIESTLWDGERCIFKNGLAEGQEE